MPAFAAPPPPEPQFPALPVSAESPVAAAPSMQPTTAFPPSSPFCVDAVAALPFPAPAFAETLVSPFCCSALTGATVCLPSPGWPLVPMISACGSAEPGRASAVATTASAKAIFVRLTPASFVSWDGPEGFAGRRRTGSPLRAGRKPAHRVSGVGSPSVRPNRPFEGCLRLAGPGDVVELQRIE